MSKERHIFCLFADDIRQEINGKVSLIGIYQGGMNVVGPVPQILPRLVISTYVDTPVDRPFGELSVDVMLDDKEMQNVTPPPQALEEMQTAARQDKEVKTVSMQMVFVLQPFQVNGNGKLWVRVRDNGEALESNPLKIQVLEGMAQEFA